MASPEKSRLVGLWLVGFVHDGTGGTNFFNTRESSDRDNPYDIEM